ncbi:MAG: amidase [Thermoanaerobaculia bacterium]|nr:amidase [Thermoanaerobaculia bacterium]
MIDADERLDDLAARFAAREGDLHAFLPEPGRFARLRREIAACRGPLAGMTLGVKDVFHVDGLPTTAGSRLPPAEFAGPEGPAVAALRAAGALVVGKTVSTEFAYFAPGPTVNPHDPTRTPGGSSSGSAAAVAAGLCDVAMGTQTIGSVIRPAAFCGVVGFKPSFGRVSTSGLVPLAPSFDHVGWFARSVAEVSRIAELLCTGWRPVALSGRPRIGVPRGPYLDRPIPAARTAFEVSLGRLAAAGFTVVDVPVFEDFDEIVTRHNRVVAAEAAQVHERWFARYAERYQARTRELIERGQTISSPRLAADLAACRAFAEGLEARMASAEIDVWVAPSALGPAPRGLEATGDPVMNLPWTQAGLPVIGLPAGRAEDMPLGLQVIARRGQDEELLAWVRALAIAEAVAS